MRIKKPPAIKPTPNNFYSAWDSVLYDTEKKLVELLLAETEKTVNILQNEFYETVTLKFPTESHEIILEIERKNKRLKNSLKTRKEKKWKKFELRKDCGRFKPNEERVRKDSNQTRVLNKEIDENNTIANPNQFKIQCIKEVNSIKVKRSSNIVREYSNKLKSYEDALKSHHVDNSTAIDIQPNNIGKLKVELRVQHEIAEKKSNPGKLNSEELRKIY